MFLQQGLLCFPGGGRQGRQAIQVKLRRAQNATYNFIYKKSNRLRQKKYLWTAELLIDLAAREFKLLDEKLAQIKKEKKKYYWSLSKNKILKIRHQFFFLNLETQTCCSECFSTRMFTHLFARINLLSCIHFIALKWVSYMNSYSNIIGNSLFSTSLKRLRIFLVHSLSTII